MHAKLTIEDQALAAAYHDNMTDSLKPTILSTFLSSSSLYIPDSFWKYIPNMKVYSKAQREDRHPWQSHSCHYPSNPSQDLHCHNKQAQLPMLQTLAFTQVRCSVSNFYNFFYWYCWHIIGIDSATVIKCFFFFPFVLALILWTFIWSHVATSYKLDFLAY